MKVLLDACVAKAARDTLTRLGHDVIWAGDWKDDPGDEEILRRARADDRVLVTLDKEFGELVVHREAAHVGVLRLVGIRSELQGSIAHDVLTRHEQTLAGGAILTAEPGRLRIRTT